MIKDITNVNNDIINIILNQQLIPRSRLAYMWLMEAFMGNRVLDLITKANIVDNELLIVVLSEYYNIPKPQITLSSIKILDYSKINQFIKKGYLIYSCDAGNYNVVINNFKCLSRRMRLRSLSKIYLIDIKYFYYFFEHNFAHLNIIKSKYYLNFLSLNLTAKNINYSKAILGFANLFHVINNIGYFVQNLLKVTLFRKAIKVKDKYFEKPLTTILPMYKVLIPLCKEEEKLETILDSLIILIIQNIS